MDAQVVRSDSCTLAKFGSFESALSRTNRRRAYAFGEGVPSLALADLSVFRYPSQRALFLARNAQPYMRTSVQQ